MVWGVLLALCVLCALWRPSQGSLSVLPEAQDTFGIVVCTSAMWSPEANKWLPHNLIYCCFAFKHVCIAQSSEVQSDYTAVHFSWRTSCWERCYLVCPAQIHSNITCKIQDSLTHSHFKYFFHVLSCVYIASPATWWVFQWTTILFPLDHIVQRLMTCYWHFFWRKLVSCWITRKQGFKLSRPLSSVTLSIVNHLFSYARSQALLASPLHIYHCALERLHFF